MKPHLCSLNWTKWSDATDGYSGAVQIRACTICERISHREIGYIKQVRAPEINARKNEVLQGESQ